LLDEEEREGRQILAWREKVYVGEESGHQNSCFFMLNGSI